ncbi:MAG TPA: hypothetical protein VHO01_11375 [Jatrophihabitans sp.]|nr:hypothetical protein [Jatrophihabitans sp.]
MTMKLRTAVRMVAVLATALGCTLAAPARPAVAITAPAGCSISGPQVPLLAGDANGAPFAALTATNNRGLWAGVRYAGQGREQVISWQGGHTTVLDTFDFGATLDEWYSVTVVGVSTAGAVVVAAEDPRAPSLARMLGFRYEGGHRYELAHNPDWISFRPTSVSPDGRVSADVITARFKAVVEWTGPGSGSIRAVATGQQVIQSGFDQYDDFVWFTGANPPETNRVHALLANGRVIELGGPAAVADGIELRAVAGRYVFGDFGGNASDAIWDLADAAALPVGTVLQPVQLSGPIGVSWVVAGAASGAHVNEFYDWPRQPYFRYTDSWGDSHPMPATFTDYGTVAPFFGLATDGTIALTTTDGNVRFMRCALNSAGHEPAGRIYTATTSSSAVAITGGALDPDLRTAPIYVDLYELTGRKTFIGRYLANQTNASAAAVWYRLGQHSFTARFTAGAGTHTYCAYGLNIRYGSVNPQLACTTVTVP